MKGMPMLCAKTFRIRLSEAWRDSDESLLNDFLESVVPEQVESAIIHHPVEPYWSVLVIYTPREDVVLSDGERILFDTYEPLTPEEEILFMKLKAWRDDIAQQDAVPRHQVLHDAHLMTLVKLHPTKAEDLEKMKGLGDRKREKYKEALLAFFRKEAR